MIELRQDQREFVAALRPALREYKSVLGQAATGFGKTVVGSYIAKRTEENNKRVIFCVHRRNLVLQTAKTFARFDINFGVIAAGYYYDKNKSVYIASIDTIRSRLNKIQAPDLLVIDEAHMAAAKTWALVVDYYQGKGSMVLGLSATPARLDSKPLTPLFKHIVLGPPPRWLIENGFLSRYTAYAPSSPDLSGVHTRAGDYVTSELEEAVNKPTITGSAIDHYKKLANGTLAICYCCSILHSKKVAADFCASGVPSAHIDGTTPDKEQKKIIQQYANREILVLCNAELITTGFDLGSQVNQDVAVETIIGLRPTQSLTLHLQMLGRGLRPKPRPAILLDHANNFRKHGLPDAEREWSLDGRPKKKNSETEPMERIRQCPECYHVHEFAPECPKCGHIYETAGREIEEVDGELEQITEEILIQDKKRLIAQAETLEDLVAVGKALGYKAGWALKVWESRQKRGLTFSELHAAAKILGFKPGWANYRWKAMQGQRSRAA